jgi:hypothetical protein
MPRSIYSQGNRSGTHWTGNWIGPGAGLDVVAKEFLITLKLKHLFLNVTYKILSTHVFSLLKYVSTNICDLYLKNYKDEQYKDNRRVHVLIRNAKLLQNFL